MPRGEDKASTREVATANAKLWNCPSVPSCQSRLVRRRQLRVRPYCRPPRRRRPSSARPFRPRPSNYYLHDVA